MKALYVFFISVSILFAVGCSDNSTANEQEAPVGAAVYNLDQTTSGPIRLDSFQCSHVSIRKGRFAPRKMPGNQHFIRRDKDSVTYSGIIYVQHEDPSHHISYHSYQYYFKASAGYSDAYLKYNTYTNEEKTGEQLQKVSTREVAYHLDFGYKQPKNIAG